MVDAVRIGERLRASTVTVPVGGGAKSVHTAQVDVNYQHNWLLLGPILSLIGGNWGASITLTATLADATWNK